MILTREQQRKVEENMGLVGKVIKDKVHGTNRYGIYSYDDLFQIGCIGLCKAAATDKGGQFSTYAYRLIWNEICDALIYANRRMETELLIDYETLGQRLAHEDEVSFLSPWNASGIDSSEAVSDRSALLVYDWDQADPQTQLELKSILTQARKDAVPSVKKGIDALVLKTQGYTSREIGENYGVEPNVVTAWISKARKYLKNIPELQQFKFSGGDA